jgi:tetratricopeptide (TPR) repeat protein
MLDEVGRGGMGVVYRAREVALNRHVAVKFLQSRFSADGAAATRFLEEAQITGQLQHPGIPPVHKVGTLPDGRPFLVMKLIKGRTLEELLKERAEQAADRGRLLAIFEQVCQAVACAHDRKVIHRDLKPANVMVGAFGEVQVMDWGLAKLLGAFLQKTEITEEAPTATVIRTLRDSEGSFTQAGSVLGTPAFMPPEQAGGEITRIDERSDVFGLGAILCVILTGKPPFVAKDSEAIRLMAIRGQLDECLARLDGCGAEPGLVALAKRCLSPGKESRPRDAGEVAKEVAALRTAADERARAAELDRVRAEGEQAKARAEAREQRKRRRVQAALGLTVLALVVGGGTGAWRLDRQAAERENERVRLDAERASEQAVAAAELASRQERTVSSVTLALDDARTRADGAWKEVEYPSRMRAATDLAVAALRRAEGFANTGAPTPELLARLDAVRTKVGNIDRHTRLLVSADAIVTSPPFGTERLPGHGKAVERMRQAFADFGWDAKTVPPETIAEQVVACRVRDKVLGFVMEWGLNETDQALKERVLTVIRRARLKAGGRLARWQEIMDRKDVLALVAFSKDPETFKMGPELLGELGRNLLSARQYEPRLVFLRQAVARYPNQAWLQWDLYTASYFRPELRSEALEHAATAAALRPDNPMFLYTVGQAHMASGEMGDARAAEAAFRRTIAADPSYPAPYQPLALILSRFQPRAAAIAALREAARTYPAGGRGVFHWYLAEMLQADGDLEGTIAEHKAAIRVDPENDAVHNYIAWILATGPDWMRDGKRAVEHATKACELSDWKDARNIETLAAAYAEVGDFDKAVEYQKKALALPANEGQAGAKAREKLELYTHKKPYRDPTLARREFVPPPREVK